jgi:protein O-GlcNAc transferase
MNRKERRAQASLGQKPGRAAAAMAAGGSVYLASAIRDHQAGRLGEAEANYRQALAIRPDYAEVMFNLAVVLRQQGKLDEAIDAYRQTIELAPDYAEAHYNLGNLLLQLAKLDDAVDAYRQAIRSRPDHANAHTNLGVALKAQGKLDEAVVAFTRATALRPDHPDGYGNLGDTQFALGRLDEAVAAYRQVIRFDPRHAGAYGNLGAALARQGHLDEAIVAYRRAIDIRPGDAEAHYNLGNALNNQGKLEAAADAYRRSIELKPDLHEARVNLGNVLCALDRLDEAVIAYRCAIEIDPADADGYYNLGNALKDQERLEEAITAYRQAIGLKPDHGGAHANLAITLTSQGQLDEALCEYRRALEIEPGDATIHSNYLLCLHYSDSETTESLYAAHQEWQRRHGRLLSPVAYANDRMPQRRLRIGYVSPDLRAHSVAYFFEPLLKHHDRQAIEIFCYAEVMRPDATTARLHELADHWLSTMGLTDDALERHIREDRIDILVDLAGHTAWNRLKVFARKPAPVQVTWLGYPNTTGLAAIDYRLVDAVTDPAGEADTCTSEALLRLEGGFLCYGGAEGAPQPTAPPSQASGIVTFGSFNNLAKVSAATVEAWAKLLTRLPRARLLLKARPFADAATRTLFLGNLARYGVDESRVELIAWVADRAAHLALYDRIDIALDPFPYNGTTTTCEALWMGVPVVTFRGHRHSGRVGASLLGQAGLDDFIADSVDDYVAIAAALAEDPVQLQELRRSLRQRLAASPLCDGDLFAREMERCLREIWQRWCEAGSRVAGNVG